MVRGHLASRAMLGGRFARKLPSDGAAMLMKCPTRRSAAVDCVVHHNFIAGRVHDAAGYVVTIVLLLEALSRVVLMVVSIPRTIEIVTTTTLALGS